MSRVTTLALLIAAITVPANAAVQVQAADGDWSKLPQLSQRGYDHLSEKMQAKLYEIASSHECPSFGLLQDRLNFRITFAVKYDSANNLERLIVPTLHCSPAESVTGGALLEMLQAGDYAPTGKSGNGWYQGTLGFNFAGDAARESSVAQVKQQQAATTKQGAIAVADPNEILCEKAEEIGTRLVTKRTCMSRAQWAEQRRLTRQDIEQLQTQRPCNFNC